MKSKFFLVVLNALFVCLIYSCKDNICPSGFSGNDCEIEDVCLTQSLECLNEGLCIDGFCNCPDGFSGVNCESADLNKVQEFLNSDIHTPYNLYMSGIPLDSLYGKEYAGGLIYYLDTISGNGFVASFSDQSEGIVWGCQGTDMNGAELTGIGEGIRNTGQISNDCDEDECAAKICYELDLNNYTDWFLPSIEGMEEMIKNLHLKGFGNFNGTKYWSSNELSSPASSTAFLAWYVEVTSGNRGGDFKSNSFYVRSARQFEP
jgi:hypothetical protein